MSMIEIKNLHKYFGDLEVLRGIDLTVDESGVCLIGSSGSGKKHPAALYQFSGREKRR